MYVLHIKPSLDKKLDKLWKKNRKQYDMIIDKAEEIVLNPQHYKNLRAPMQYLKEGHIDKHFVLTFSVDKNEKTVTLEDFGHHDDILK